MPRPKPPADPVQFHVKLPPSEFAALATLIPLWADDVAAKRAEQGDHAPPPATSTAWLRAMIREQAARYHVKIDDAPPRAPATSPTPKKKASAKRAKP